MLTVFVFPWLVGLFWMTPRRWWRW